MEVQNCILVTSLLFRSSDGKYVVISSTDGYCSFVKFDDGELGTPILYDPIEYQVTQAQIRKAAKKDSKKKESKKVDSEKLDATTPVENRKIEYY